MKEFLLRKKVTNRILVLLLISFLLGLFPPRVLGQAQSQAITLRLDENLLSLDPAHIANATDHAIAYVIYNGLVRHKPGTAELEGDLAKSWSVSKDGLQYTFELKRGIKWHKGFGELTARDVVYSFTRITDRKTGSRYRADLAPVKAVEAVDDHTARIIMSEPYPAFLDAVLAYRPGFIVNQKAIESLGDKYLSGPIGTGPYVFESWVPAERVELRRNPDYFGPSSAIERVTFRIIRDDTVAEIALLSGQIDGAYIQEPEIQARVVRNRSLSVLQRPMPRTIFLEINTNRTPLSDIRVRQAMAHAIDKQALLKHVFLGMGKVAYSPLNPMMFGYLDEPGLTYDIEKAKRLLAAAGFPEGIPQTLSYATTSIRGNPELAEAIQHMWLQVGIRTKIEVQERGLVEERRRRNDFDIMNSAFLRTEPSQFLLPNLHSMSLPYPNISGYRAIDRLIDQARFEVDSNKRRAHYYLVQRRVMRDIPILPLLYPIQVLGLKRTVQGAAIGLLNYPVWQMSIRR